MRYCLKYRIGRIKAEMVAFAAEFEPAVVSAPHTADADPAEPEPAEPDTGAAAAVVASSATPEVANDTTTTPAPHPTTHQNTALLWQYPTGAAEGCDRVAGLQRDHRHDWATTKITLLAWLDRLCEHHHDLKTRHRWPLIAVTGKRPFVPPDDAATPPTPTNPTSPERARPHRLTSRRGRARSGLDRELHYSAVWQSASSTTDSPLTVTDTL